MQTKKKKKNVLKDGISQPELWERWLNDSGRKISKQIGIAVQCNNMCNIINGHDFINKYKIDLERPTGWGKLTVVLAFQQSLRLALEKFPNANKFFMISGREIPLISAENLLKFPQRSQMQITNLAQRWTYHKKLGHCQWFKHHASNVLTRKHVWAIVLCPIPYHFSDCDDIYEG